MNEVTDSKIIRKDREWWQWNGEADAACGSQVEGVVGVIAVRGGAMHTYHHDLLLVRAAMLVRRFPLTQRGRLRDISVGVNGG